MLGITPQSFILDKRVLALRYNMPVGKISNFFEKLRGGKVSATRCNACNELYFPPQVHCPKCNSEDVSWVDLSGEATLETFTKIVVKPTSFSDNEDYVVAIGRMIEGINVLATLDIMDERDVEIGMKLRLIPVERNGNLSYLFIPKPDNKGK
ncbi:MAG: Zn-ribbon domain-containing OB-fold protein [Thermoplasmata archaeon]